MENLKNDEFNELLEAAHDVMLYAQWSTHPKTCSIWDSWNEKCNCGVHATRDRMRALLKTLPRPSDNS